MKTLAKISQFFNKTFALWVLVFGALAYFFPDVFKPFGKWVTVLLGIVMFGMGLTLTLSDFKEVLTRPRDVAIGVVGQFIIILSSRPKFMSTPGRCKDAGIPLPA